MPDAVPTPPAYIAHPQALKRLDWRIGALLAALFVISMALNTYRNEFPYFYHPDEPGKVRQVISGDRNFNHPMFMLEMADGVAGALQTPRESQPIVELGRWLSAFYLAVTTLCVAWLIWQWWGIWAAGASGLLFAMAPDVIELSHAFKEDAALAMGIGLFFVAALLWEAREHWRRLIAFGLVAGLCASTKYVGFLALPLGLILLWWRAYSLRLHGPAGHWRRLLGQMGIFLLTAAISFGAFNYKMALHRAEAARSLERETELVRNGQGKTAKDTPHTGFIERFVARGGVLFPFYLIGCWGFWQARGRRKRYRAEWLYLAFPLLLTLLLSFSAKDSGRYFLPAILGITSTGVVGAVLVADWIWRWKNAVRVPLVGALVLVIAGFAGERAITYLRGFKLDARADLLNFLEKNTPPNAVLLQGDRIFLPAPDHRYADAWRIKAPREIRTTKSVADEAETPAQLRAKGITHVALNHSEYNRYLSEDTRPKEGSEAEFARRRAFYQALFKDARLLWESQEAKIGPNNPSLKLYELPARNP